MQAWIIRILCAAVLSVLVEIIIPSGKLKGFVSLAASIMLMIVIISPLGTLLKSEIPAFNANTEGSIRVDSSYIQKKAESDVLAILSSYEGYDGTSVHIYIDDSNSKVAGVQLTVPRQNISLALATIKLRDSAVKGIFSALYRIEEAKVEINREGE